jgi:hypothetical protein
MGAAILTVAHDADQIQRIGAIHPAPSGRTAGERAIAVKSTWSQS